MQTLFLMNLDRFSWTNHGKRRPKRIPSKNHAKSPRKSEKNHKMSMKFLQKSTKLTYFEILDYVPIFPQQNSANLNWPVFSFLAELHIVFFLVSSLFNLSTKFIKALSHVFVICFEN